MDQIFFGEIYKAVTTKMSDGLLCGRINYDQEGNPESFLVIDINPAFRQITGFCEIEITTKNFFDLQQKYPSQAYDWVQTAARQVTNGKSKILEFYSKHLHQFFSVTICGFPHGYFSIQLHDITKQKLLEEALVASQEKCDKLFLSSPTCIAITTLNEGLYLEVNNTFIETFGFSKDELIGQNSLELNIWLCKEDRDAIISEVKEKGLIKNRELCFRIKSGKIRVFLVSIDTIVFDDKDSLIFSLHDITPRKIAEEEYKKSKKRLESIFSSSPDAIVVSNIDGVIMDCNEEMLSMLGYKKKRYLLGKSLFNFILPEETMLVLRHKVTLLKKGSCKNSQFTLATHQGHRIYVECSSSLIKDGSSHPQDVVTICKNISLRKQTEMEIKYLSYHDKLTGLYNRAFFEEELHRLDTERQLPLSLIVGDLNGLKLTNDVFGHHEGDRLLQKLAMILKQTCRKEDIVSRWGGDEFAIILPKTTNDIAIRICKRIIQACQETSLDPIQLSIAVGYATKTERSEDIQIILKEAEDWMYRHKLLESRSVRSSILASLQKTLFEKSYETEEHAQRIRQISIRLGNAMGLSSTELDELSLFSVLHDIGKIAIPETILMKPEPLEQDEWEQIKKHPEIGYRIAESSQELSHISEYILTHHEYWNGMGYPRGLKGAKIPKLSRILSIVDAYDVMINIRPYKKIMTHEEALFEIKKGSGTQFDPAISKIFIEMMS